MKPKTAKKGCVPTDTSGCVKNDTIDVSVQTPSIENQKQTTSGFALVGEQTLVENKYDVYANLNEIEDDDYE